MKGDIRIQLVGGIAMLSVDDLVRLLKAAGGKMVTGKLHGVRSVSARAERSTP
jgi:hypothetical protein